ncbi:MAG: GTP-binding protein [Pygmaiobacter sp.]|nr:GTP-binding protein [Pygmaiobacter sp.]
MTKIDIFSGFLGAGKTTLIKKLIQEAYTGEKLVLIENEFGEIGIDGGFLKEAGIEITEMNSGCICCSLVGDFGKALEKVLAEYAPDRILIEPSGVGKLSDVIRAVQGVAKHTDVALSSFTTVADATKCRVYSKNFGEFYNDQIQNAGTIILSRTNDMPTEKLDAATALLRSQNPNATLITTPWDELEGAQILTAMERQDTLQSELQRLAEEAQHSHEHDDEDDHEHEHHHDHEHEHEHEHGEDCTCGCHDHDEHDEHEHHHDHAHEQEHGEDCTCGCHDHDHEHDHHHHHADEVFSSWGVETAHPFTEQQITAALAALADAVNYGIVLRAKGIVPAQDGSWLHFDYVPGESNVRHGAADVTGRLCVIGSKLDNEALAELFQLA